MPADPAVLDSAVHRVLDAAARRGVLLEIHRLADTTHTAADAARALGVEQAQIVTVSYTHLTLPTTPYV